MTKTSCHLFTVPSRYTLLHTRVYPFQNRLENTFCKTKILLAKHQPSQPSMIVVTAIRIVLYATKCFVFYATNPYSGIRAVSKHRLVARVEHNCFVGVDSLLSLV
jgi:hypothetical protein